jgi:hypothetical protein
MEKAGIAKGQEKDSAATVMEAVKGMMSKDPMKLASLFSANPGTDDDKKVEGEIVQSFSSCLQAKAFSMDKIGSLTAMLPLLMNMFKGEAKGAKGGGKKKGGFNIVI